MQIICFKQINVLNIQHHSEVEYKIRITHITRANIAKKEILHEFSFLNLTILIKFYTIDFLQVTKLK